MPGSANGVMFTTLEDEGANANLIAWPSVLAPNRRAIVGATLIGCRGRVQNENGVIHVVVEHVADLSVELKRVSGLDTAFKVGRERHGQPRSQGADSAASRHVRTPPTYRHAEVKARNFR
jgi:error-prone DNA polymerase